MVFKYITVLVFVAVVNSGVIHVPQHPVSLEHHQPAIYQHTVPQQHLILLQKTHAAHEEYPDDPHPKYNFAYEVQDSISGDSKSQTESRDGGVVRGEYSLTDADGFRRTVKYTADDINGFNAVVHREPITGHKDINSAHATSVQISPLHTTQYHHAPISYVTPTSVPSYKIPVNYHAHPEQAHQTYTTYDIPQLESHESHYHK